MSSWLLLALSLCGGWLTWNVYRPKHAPGRRAVVSFVAGWLVAELSLHQVALWAFVTAVLVAEGALRGLAGRIGLGITVVSCAALLAQYLRGWNAADAVEEALRGALGPDYRAKIRPEISARLCDGIEWKWIALPFPMRRPDVERVRDVVYRRVRGVDLKLDVYRRRTQPAAAPVLLEIHGGGWVVGSKNDQGIPLVLRMAGDGWLCVSANYRLSPHATFPDHLIDLKHALRWIREHAREYGGDPDFVVVAGQSAGGHLASLMALTANDASLQPGFEDVDTSVRGCVSFYGVYDFTDRHGLWHHRDLARLLEEKVMKASLDEDREAYEKASPMARVSADAPPFLVIHGDRDTMVPVEEARRFCALLRERARAPVAYAEIRGAQHAFEIFPSLRGELVLMGVERFLAWLWSEAVTARRSPPVSTAQAS